MLSYWKLFSLTGDLDTYLLHKENERYSEDEFTEDERLQNEGD
ncbi:YqzL family protein [Geomicrobium sp. JSM 1781026]|nr:MULTISPECIES: YqzL family protein [unclassified Geomicrobium]